MNDRTAPGWCLPGGKKEAWESIQETAVRELQEETAITGVTLNYVGSYQTTVKEQPTDVRVFEVFLPDRYKPLVKISDKHEGYVWANLDDIYYLPLAGKTGVALTINNPFYQTFRDILPNV